MKKDFLIDNIDPLGQGVSKVNDSITFIKKTLPGEHGIATVFSSKKGVEFATVFDLKSKSPDRITPECPHYIQCNGCDFLHTSHAKEIELKLNNIKRSLGFLDCREVEFHAAKNRLHYRNRIQLHYNKKTKKLGFLDSKHQIINVDNCQIGTKLISAKLKELYQDSAWLRFVGAAKTEGHIELYEKNNVVEVSVNKDYAQGGFTQVNQEMNEKLRAFLGKTIKTLVKPSETIFDLFGGNGNLTKSLENPTLVVDTYQRSPQDKFNQRFFHQDLYKDKAIANIKEFYSKKPDLIIFDPPRSGLKNITEFVTEFNPGVFILISCQFSSFTRDAKPLLDKYHLSQVHVFDLFPGTHHFETIGIFTKRT